MEIVNITDPDTPLSVGQFIDYTVERVHIVGTYLYMACRGEGLVVLDVSDPIYPQEIMQFDYGQNCIDIFMDDSFVYTADLNEGLKIVDIAYDTDEDRMSDCYEDHYGLNLNDNSDATIDSDGDGLSNLEEYTSYTNPYSTDTDQDGMSDKWEVDNYLNPNDYSDKFYDFDVDYLLNWEEYLHNTDPNDFDSDDDGLDDYEEIYEYGTDPNDFDSDDDGLDDAEEIYEYGTDPNDFDSDDDGLDDGWEINNNLNPNNSSDAETDNDGDGLSNLQEYNFGTDPNNSDSDGDGYSDSEEIEAGTDPLNESSHPFNWTIILIMIGSILGITTIVIIIIVKNKKKLENIKKSEPTLEENEAAITDQDITFTF